MTTAARALIHANTSEAELQAWVVGYATLRGWMVYHTYDSRRSQPGFPDLVLARRGRVIFAELKSERGRLSAEQEAWRDHIDACVHALEHAACGAEWYCWRPSDETEIQKALA